jgi:hypothetical protein
MIEYIDDVIAEVASEMIDAGIRANDLNDPEFDSAEFAMRVMSILNQFCDFDTKIFCEMKNHEMLLDLNK